MAFREHLPPADLLILTRAAIEGGLLDLDDSLLFEGIARGYALSRKRAGNPLDQFQMDLRGVNKVERLSDGQVPIVQWLTNAGDQLTLRGRIEGKAFLQYASAIANRAQGVARLPDPSGLPEVVKREVIVGRDDMVDLGFLQRGLTVAGSVGRILVPRIENGARVKVASGGPSLVSGTAWLIAPELAITNHPVVNARRSDEPDAGATDFLDQGRQASIDFDFDSDRPVGTPALIAKVEIASSALDYAILRLAGTQQAGARRVADDKRSESGDGER